MYSGPNIESGAGEPTCTTDASFVAAGFSCWSLIGGIGNGAPFEVGAGVSFTPSASGHLYLGVNDQSCCLFDNTGNWTAVIALPNPVTLTLSVPVSQPWTDTGLDLPAGSSVGIWRVCAAPFRNRKRDSPGSHHTRGVSALNRPEFAFSFSKLKGMEQGHAGLKARLNLRSAGSFEADISKGRPLSGQGRG